MKNTLLILFMFAASGLSSCSTAQYPQSGVSDDVYYSSKDKSIEQEKASVEKQKKTTLEEQETLFGKRKNKTAYRNNSINERVSDNRRKQPAEEVLRPFARALVEIALWSVLWHHSWNWPNIFIQF